MKKEEALQEVINLMCEHGLATSDVERGLAILPAKEKFDLAVKDEHGYINRLPFSLHSAIDREKIVGIYPLKNSDYYLELGEEAYIHGNKVERFKLPSEHYMDSLKGILRPLNAALLELGALEVKGIYHARLSNDASSHVIVYFKSDGVMEVHPSGRFAPAKCRYVAKA